MARLSGMGFNDITAKKLARATKEFDQKNLSALINNTHDLIWSVGCNFNLITSMKLLTSWFTGLPEKAPKTIMSFTLH